MAVNPTKFEFLGREVAYIEDSKLVIITEGGTSYEDKFFNALAPYLSDFLFALLPEGTRFEGIKIRAYSNDIADMLSFVPELRGEKIKIGSDKVRKYIPLPKYCGGELIDNTPREGEDATPDEMDSKYFSLGGMQKKYTANLIQTDNGDLIVQKADQEQYFANLIIKNENTTDRLRYSGINEFYCMMLANKCGVYVPKTFLIKNGNDGYDYAIERFGISQDHAGKYMKRVVLDMAVFFGKVFMENKYHCSSPELFGVMQDILDEDNFRKFCKAYLYGYMIGNADMHLRNFSVFANYDEDHDSLSFELTPIYDMICIKCYERYQTNDLGLGLYTAGIAGAVPEDEFFDFISEYMPLMEIKNTVEDINKYYKNLQEDIINLTGHGEYRVFLDNICGIIEKRILNMKPLLEKAELQQMNADSRCAQKDIKDCYWEQ